MARNAVEVVVDGQHVSERDLVNHVEFQKLMFSRVNSKEIMRQVMNTAGDVKFRDYDDKVEIKLSNPPKLMEKGYPRMLEKIKEYKSISELKDVFRSALRFKCEDIKSLVMRLVEISFTIDGVNISTTRIKVRNIGNKLNILLNLGLTKSTSRLFEVEVQLIITNIVNFEDDHMAYEFTRTKSLSSEYIGVACQMSMMKTNDSEYSILIKSIAFNNVCLIQTRDLDVNDFGPLINLFTLIIVTGETEKYIKM